MPDDISPAALVSEIVRTFKASAMYPEGHPERRRFFDRLDARFSVYLQQQPALELRIDGESLLVDGQAVETSDGSGELIARECFARQVGAVRFLRGIAEPDLAQFFYLLAMKPEAVREAGGALEVMRRHTSGSVQVEQVDYAGILEKRVEVPAGEDSRYVTGTQVPAAVPDGLVDRGSRVPNLPGTDGAEISQQEWLEGKLRELDEAQTETQYQSVLRDITIGLRTGENLGFPEYGVQVLKHLGRHLLTGGRVRDPEAVRGAVRDLARPEEIEELAAQITAKDGFQRENIQAVLEEVREVSIPILLRCLADEEEAYGRGVLLNVLERIGESVRPHLEKWLEDDRWYVVRNALGLMQQVGGSGDAAGVREFLDHPSSKVRLEALRFLSRYPAHVSEERMNRLLGDEDHEVRARAVYALGGLQGSRGIQRLESLAQKPLLGEGDVLMREMALKAIGRQGGREAVPFLMGLLKKRSFLRTAKRERIQRAVINSMAEIDDPVVVENIRKALHRLKGEIYNAAEDLLRRREGREEERRAEGKGSDQDPEAGNL